MKVGYKDDGDRLLSEAADDIPKGTKCINWTLGTFQREGSTALGQATQRESGNSILKRFSSSSKTKPWLTQSRAARSTALRLPKAPFNQHFMRLQNQWGGLISFSCPVPHSPLNWKSQGPLGFYFSHIWATAEINTSFLRWFRQNILWFKALCKKRDSGTNPKMHQKKNMQKDTIWGKKKIQANKQSDAFVKKNV